MLKEFEGITPEEKETLKREIKEAREKLMGQQQMLREHVSVILHASASGKKTSSSARSMQGIPAACCP